MKRKKSTYITPIAIIIDLIILNLTLFFLNEDLYLNKVFISYINITWLVIVYYTDYYDIHRYSKILRIVSKSVIQLGIFFLAYFAYFGIFKEGEFVGKQSATISVLYPLLISVKLIYLILLRKYRIEGGNYRNVIIIGSNQSIESIKLLFGKRKDFGYRLQGYFSEKNKKSGRYLGTVDHAYDYVLQNNIDEVYCSIAELNQEQLKQIIDFGNKNQIEVKLIPDSKGVFSKGMVLEYYDYIPVLSLKKLPFDNLIIKYSKRVFDIAFSLFIITFVLSWLSVILYILVKLETKGPLIFKQSRDGLNGTHFVCYKFRSMGVNPHADKLQATKGDVRVTKMGKFMRKTSIDELPQFFNVLKGEMSVVGPRPHMTSQSKRYARIVDKYFVRNLVKPGVTGLAQIKGYRGEIENHMDIENRVRMDIFYINNWSFLLDIKIIIQTVINALGGESKAY